MAFRLLLGFLPWILLSALFGKTEKEIWISLLVTAVVFLGLEWKSLKQGFLLSLGIAFFLIFTFIGAVILKNTWVINHNSFLSNITLATIAWGSLGMGKPFTLQYARQQIAPSLWNKPGFIRVNQILTAIWGSVFLLSALFSFITLSDTLSSKILKQILGYGPIVAAIWITVKFPNWYREKQRKLQNMNNYYLQGNYAPLREESDFKNLPITGKIPEGLEGVYMRNGPNPAFEPISYTYPFDGDGMIHAIYLQNQQASYRNRYVKTKGFLLEQKHGRAIYGGITNPIPPDPRFLGPNDSPFKNGAFINVIHHAGHNLAMWEGGPAYEIDAQLHTLGEWKPDNLNPLAVGPHGRFDLDTQELYLITYDVFQPFLTYHRIDKQGSWVETKVVDKPYSTMIHDFAMTKNYLVFFDCPAVLDFQAAASGGDLLKWQEELGTRIGIMARGDASQPAIWLKKAAFFVFHFVNAFEQNNLIFVDYVRHNRLGFAIASDEPRLPPQLYRMTIDLTKKTTEEKLLTNYGVEFPTFNHAYEGQEYRFIYAPTRLGNKRTFNALIKHDIKNNTTTLHDFGEDCEIGEASFAAKPDTTGEDNGYLMLFVYNKKKNSSDFVILDAQDLTKQPIAQIALPRRVPHGLHGNWLPTLKGQLNK